MSGVLERVWAAARGGKRVKKAPVRKEKIALRPVVESDSEVVKQEVKKRVRVLDAQHYIKVELLKALPDITEKMLKEGKAAQLRLLWNLGGLHEDPTATKKRPGLTLGEMLLREAKKKAAAVKAVAGR